MRKLLALILLSCCFVTVSATQSITLILDWFVNPDHAPIIIAEQQGYFAKQGLDVKIVAPANPSDGPKFVASGKADITIDYAAGILVEQKQGLPLVRVGTLVDQPLSTLAVLKSSGIKSLADLKGKKVGSSSPATDSVFLKAMLHKQGLTLKDVNLINVNYNLVQALLTHQVDAVTGVMRNVEPIEMQLQGYPVTVFLPEENGIPPYDELIFVVNKKSANAAWVKKFLTAVGQGVAYLKQHPEQSWEAFAKAYPEDNNAVNKLSWFGSITYFARNPAYIDWKKQAGFAKFLKQNGLI